MGFRYLDRIATEKNIHAFLELADLAAGAGASANNVFQLSHRLRQSRPMQVCRALLQRDPAAVALIEQRRLSGPYDAAALQALPKGSLGHTYATVLETMGYDINFFPNPDFYANLETDADYINYRVYATHDIHHIVSGFSLDNFGELGVISMSVAQFAHPGLAFTDLMALLLNWFRNDKPLDEHETPAEQARTAGYAFGMISKGLHIGAEARPLFPVIWEERMEQNLEELRAELGIEAVTEGTYSWQANPALSEALAASDCS
ncbi:MULTISPECIES: Coq4 family protein [unclassified Cyanobium]|uniref:Coq4 family protein n=1 Tax=unclassified Cyanobium TaxID=2627006 RepID=UPI0020CC251A|nr:MULTISPECIES: Coq4 family protein [unclassified Cyanobium]MCP9832872.1 pyrroloquinoline quinone biosynthesis protein [Cyanobium sp. La Preciosa 7G6]MCP9935622.1 pyrroloquinoline quinone biosynthesis protein [Cyanobium sp. Aljojuca 7A6]